MTHKENKLLIRKYANAIWTCMSLQINKQSVFLNMQFCLFMRTITPSFFISKVLTNEGPDAVEEGLLSLAFISLSFL